jgi:uncharacterized Zn finger protein (UPF0148 family)
MAFTICPECGVVLSSQESEAEYCNNCGEDFSYEDFDEDDWREEMEERRQEELAERAALCKCGAWQFAKNGSVVHVADCCCGAE